MAGQSHFNRYSTAVYVRKLWMEMIRSFTSDNAAGYSYSESSPWSFDECKLTAIDGRQPLNQAIRLGPCVRRLAAAVHIHHRHFYYYRPL